MTKHFRTLIMALALIAGLLLQNAGATTLNEPDISYFQARDGHAIVSVIQMATTQPDTMVLTLMDKAFVADSFAIPVSDVTEESDGFDLPHDATAFRVFTVEIPNGFPAVVAVASTDFYVYVFMYTSTYDLMVDEDGAVFMTYILDVIHDDKVTVPKDYEEVSEGSLT
jgi:hypothetical protein